MKMSYLRLDKFYLVEQIGMPVIWLFDRLDRQSAFEHRFVLCNDITVICSVCLFTSGPRTSPLHGNGTLEAMLSGFHLYTDYRMSRLKSCLVH